MGPPPQYPRVPQLVARRGSRDDLVLGDGEVAALLAHPVVVEEKLDGANVVIWADETDGVECALRSGPGSMDRAGQRGPLRAWVAAHGDAFRPALEAWPVLYAEWMLLSHSVAYDRLPSYLVALDLWREHDGFASVDERDSICRAAGLVTPPELWRGTPTTLEDVEALAGRSTWGEGPMEGVVVRRVDQGPSGPLSGKQGPSGPGSQPPPRLAKLVRAEFARVGDEDWRSGRPRNRLAAAPDPLKRGAASWR